MGVGIMCAAQVGMYGEGPQATTPAVLFFFSLWASEGEGGIGEKDQREGKGRVEMKYRGKFGQIRNHTTCLSSSSCLPLCLFLNAQNKNLEPSRGLIAENLAWIYYVDIDMQGI